MSARRLLLTLPGGVDVFRTIEALRFHIAAGWGGASYSKAVLLAEMKKGNTGWACFDGRLLECVTFQDEKGRVWKIKRIGVMAHAPRFRTAHRSERLHIGCAN